MQFGQKQQAPLKLSKENSSYLLHEVSFWRSRAPNSFKFSTALTHVHSLGTKKAHVILDFIPTQQQQKQHKTQELSGKKILLAIRNEDKNKVISFTLSFKNSITHKVLVLGVFAFSLEVLYK